MNGAKLVNFLTNFRVISCFGVKGFWFDLILIWFDFDSILIWIDFDLIRFWFDFDSIFIRFWFDFDWILIGFWLDFDSILIRFWFKRIWHSNVLLLSPLILSPAEYTLFVSLSLCAVCYKINYINGELSACLSLMHS